MSQDRARELEEARRHADQLHRAIYKALRDGANVLVRINDPLPHCSANVFYEDKRSNAPE